MLPVSKCEHKGHTNVFRGGNSRSGKGWEGSSEKRMQQLTRLEIRKETALRRAQLSLMVCYAWKQPWHMRHLDMRSSSSKRWLKMVGSFAGSNSQPKTGTSRATAIEGRSLLRRSLPAWPTGRDQPIRNASSILGRENGLSDVEKKPTRKKKKRRKARHW